MLLVKFEFDNVFEGELIKLIDELELELIKLLDEFEGKLVNEYEVVVSDFFFKLKSVDFSLG